MNFLHACSHSHVFYLWVGVPTSFPQFRKMCVHVCRVQVPPGGVGGGGAHRKMGVYPIPHTLLDSQSPYVLSDSHYGCAHVLCVHVSMCVHVGMCVCVGV